MVKIYRDSFNQARASYRSKFGVQPSLLVTEEQNVQRILNLIQNILFSEFNATYNTFNDAVTEKRSDSLILGLLIIGLSLLTSVTTVADLRGAQGTPPRLKISSFSCRFWENWPNNRLAPPLWGWRPSSGKSWI